MLQFAQAQNRVQPKPVTNNNVKVTAIEIQSNKKIESDAIRAVIQSEVNSNIDLEQIRLDISSIFNMGYFDNVEVKRIDQDGGVKLVFSVKEKPSIIEISFQGNSDIKEEDLRTAIAIKNYSILNLNSIQDALEKMQKLYEDKGFFLAKIDYKLEEIGENKENLKLVFNIEENDKVIVKRIHIIGNNKLSDNMLKSRMATQEGGLFGFMSGSGSYKQEIFDRDMMIINASYLNEGYLQAKIDRPEIYVSPDKKSIYLTIRVEEGEQFEVGNIDFTGDILFSRDELFEAISIDEQKTFAYEVMQKDLGNLQLKYGDLGYAFANVIPRVRLRESERKADITFEIEKGEKVYFGKIQITGNSRTRDKVIRRELEIKEGELYNETKKRDSLAAVKRLGFFDDVSFRTSTPKDQPRLLDIQIVVKERNTGSIQLGAGYSSYYGFILNGSLSESNLFGRGQRLSLNVQHSSKKDDISVSFTEPHIFDTDWSFGVDAFHKFSELTDAYQELRRGGGVRVGHPLAKYLYGYLSYKYEDTHMELNDNGDSDLYRTDTANGITSSMTASLEYDRRDDRLSPKNGVFGSLSFQYAGFGGDNQFTRTYLNSRYYKNIFWDVVWRNNFTLGMIEPLGDREVPFNELYLLGGPNTIRGFSFFSIGPRKFSSVRGEYRPYGGTKQMVYNLEFEFPLIQEVNIKGVVFYDIGNAQDDFDLGVLRQGAGFGFRWISPIGPLRFEWGFPIDRASIMNEKVSTRIGVPPVAFEFSIGTPF